MPPAKAGGNSAKAGGNSAESGFNPIIKNQEEHHSKKSYLQEENELISRFGFILRKY